MAHSTRHRPASPGSKRLMDPMRASTGTVPLGSSLDMYASPASYYGYDPHTTPRSSIERIPDIPYRNSHDPRVGGDRKLEAQPISTKAFRDQGHSTKLRTEYAIRPRPRSNTASGADSTRHPLSLTIPSSPSRPPPLITTIHDRPPSPLHPRSAHSREDSERYLMPASSTHSPRHRRIYSHDYASDNGRLDPERVRMDRGYRVYRSSGRHGHPLTGDLRRDDVDDYDAYSYTNAKEQFEKDFASRPTPEKESYRRERPVSMTGLESYLPYLSRKEPREFGPPPSQRGFDKLDKDEKHRRVGRTRAGSDVSRESAGYLQVPRQRAPVAVHQERDDGYSSYREDHGDRRHSRRRHRRHEDDIRSRDRRDDRDSRSDKLLPAMAGGLATAGLASGYSKDLLDYDGGSKHRHRSRDPSRSYSTTRTDDGHKEHRRRRARSSLRRPGSDSDESSSDEALHQYTRARSQHRRIGELKNSDYAREQRSLDSETDSSDNQRMRRARRRNRDSRHSDESITRETSQESQDRQKKPVAVDTAAPKEPEAPPKGILKRPRERFPEEPTTVREGVAPLKDAQKNGIPPGARWTKIDRRLVNPAALEAGHERFEERAEYVIVLRVLTKEEIQAYAVKTQEIRGESIHNTRQQPLLLKATLTCETDARYKAERRERRQRREAARRQGLRRESDSSSYDDDTTDEDKTPLALEAPPEEQLPMPQQAQSRATNAPVPEPVRK
ncbi:palmitoyltransferase pfa5 [Paecilomyces lecythidis]|uniref:Palmitoyltransferase pfa5 n=1 Tax=Paecilomyces lecythidis TaxID=3004212 RepID=A0ABR3XT28_9EURO